MSPTRLQAFRQRNRHRPVKQVAQLGGLCLLFMVYSFAFFHYQPDRSHATIVSLNNSLKTQAKQTVKGREEYKQLSDNTSKLNKSNHEDVSRNAVDEPRDPRKNSDTSKFTNILFLFYVLMLLSRLYSRSRGPSGRESRRQQRLLQEQRQARFQEWAQRLNFQRQSNGQQPISLESLRLVMRERDMTGEDYDSLLQFDEEAGSAVDAMLSSVGASQDEIDRCPLRTIRPGDELLTRTHEGRTQQCAICLEGYQEGQEVRTIPCFHSFHRGCIDPWLVQRAVCPICKHSAIS